MSFIPLQIWSLLSHCLWAQFGSWVLLILLNFDSPLVFWHNVMIKSLSCTKSFKKNFFYLMGEGNGTPLQYSYLENPMDGGAWKAVVHGVAKSQTWQRFHFHALEKETATHSSILAWRIPGTGEPDGPLSMGLHRVGHNWSDLAAAAAAAAAVPRDHISYTNSPHCCCCCNSLLLSCPLLLVVCK